MYMCIEEADREIISWAIDGLEVVTYLELLQSPEDLLRGRVLETLG